MAVAERIEVADATERDRYELSIDGQVVGFATYRARPGLIAFVHTKVAERLQGRGLADRLIRFALEDARARGLAVLPFCPFVKAFIERHREFETLVPVTYREQFGLPAPANWPTKRMDKPKVDLGDREAVRQALEVEP
jgi:uncharacterized protein